MDKSEFTEFLRRHKWTILCVGLGFMFVVLILTINFWRTLLLYTMTGLCFLLGYLLDKGGPAGVKEFFKKLLSK